MGLRITQEEYAKFAGRLVETTPEKPAGKVAKRSDGWPGFRSKWESAYSLVLDDQKAAGEILEWQYEGMTLHVTEAVIVEGKRRPGVRYKPDFCVWLPDGRLRCVEIKGFARQKDILRYKMAREKFRQIEFKMFRRTKCGWEIIL